MFTLINRELKSLFLKPFTLTVFILLLLIPAIILSVFISLGNPNEETGHVVYAGFENIISTMGLVFAIVIPAVVIYILNKERKDRTIVFLVTLPVSRKSVMLSKLFSLSIFFLLPTALMAVFPLVFSSYGTVNYIQSYSGLMMLVFFELFLISFSFLIASRSINVLKASIISYATLVLSYVAGICAPLVRFLPFGTGFDIVAEGILDELSIFKKLDRIIYEVFDWTSLAFFAVAAVAFIFIASFYYGRETKYSVEANNGKRNDRIEKKDKKQINGRKIGVACASLILVVCIGVLPTFMPYSVRLIDISKNSIYTPDEKTEEFLSKLDEDVTVYLINPYSGNDELYNSIVTLTEKSDRITLEIVNSVESTDFLKEYGLPTDTSENTLNALSYAMIIQGEKRRTVITQNDYYAFKVGEQYLSSAEFQNLYVQYARIVNNLYPHINQLSDNQLELLEKSLQFKTYLETQTLECLDVASAIMSAIDYVTADIIPSVYFASGHGEKADNLNVFDIAKNAELPKDADALVINSPSKDYAEEDVKKVIDYVDNRGGKLYILADKDNYSMPNFSALLKHYGLSVETGAITENEDAVVEINVNKEHEAFKGVTSTVKMAGVDKIVVDGSSVYKYDTMLSYTEKTEAEESEETANEDSKETANEDSNETDNENIVSYPVAVSVSEGEEKKVILLTGAVTFNDKNDEITDEYLVAVSNLLKASLDWLFDGFTADIPDVTPKVFQKLPYTAQTADVVKTVVVFAVIIPSTVFIIALSRILSKKLRSKKAKDNNPEIY